MLAVYMTPLQDKLLTSNATSFETRRHLVEQHSRDQGQTRRPRLGGGVVPAGVYRQYEDHSAVTRTFANLRTMII